MLFFRAYWDVMVAPKTKSILYPSVPIPISMYSNQYVLQQYRAKIPAEVVKHITALLVGLSFSFAINWKLIRIALSTNPAPIPVNPDNAPANKPKTTPK